MIRNFNLECLFPLPSSLDWLFYHQSHEMISCVAQVAVFRFPCSGSMPTDTMNILEVATLIGVLLGFVRQCEMKLLNLRVDFSPSMCHLFLDVPDSDCRLHNSASCACLGRVQKPLQAFVSTEVGMLHLQVHGGCFSTDLIRSGSRPWEEKVEWSDDSLMVCSEFKALSFRSTTSHPRCSADWDVDSESEVLSSFN